MHEEINREEAENRLNGAAGGKYANVGFSYSDDQNNTGANENGITSNDAEAAKDNKVDEKLFAPPENCEKFPKNIKLPKYQREHDIIEKTANFLAKQSIQMEILLKAKQAELQNTCYFLDF